MKHTLLDNIANQLILRKLCCAVAESCTGGLLGAHLSAKEGASAWFWGGIIAYDNHIKQTLLHVPHTVLAEHGAVSEAVAQHMAFGVCRQCSVDVGLSVTGIAGPDGGTIEKPVGTVWIGLCVQGQTTAFKNHFLGNRETVRLAATEKALIILHNALQHSDIKRQT